MEHHTHSHNHAKVSPEEVLALLEYMLGHNRHHAEDLHALTNNINGEALDLINEAVKNYEIGNDKLEQAFKILKGE